MIKGNVILMFLYCMTLTLCILCISSFHHRVYAHTDVPLAITNVELASYDTTADTATIQFDIAWDYTWRNAINYDAVWVFVKYKTASDTDWEHATLKTSGTNPSGFSTGTDAGNDNIDIEIIVPTDKKGCFIQPDDIINGEGDETVDVDSIQIVWDYGLDGVSRSAVDDCYIKVFGVEMAYVPTGGFYAGDNTSDFALVQGSIDDDPWYIASEEQIAVEDVLGDGYYYKSALNDGEDTTGAEFVLHNSFPKGYAAFYVMKRELSQGMYREFLNALTAVQKESRTAATLSGDDGNTYVMLGEQSASVLYRQTIKALPEPTATGSDYTFVCDYDDDDVGNESDDGEWIAMNYVTWMDLCAYADWAALRPMTELEYEKACRGSDIPSVSGEYAWGTVDITQASAAFYSEGTEAEVSASIGTDYLCAYGDTIIGPFRSGFASTNASDRESAGATYYGVLDMSGNVYERVVTVGNDSGRQFRGTHGDGELSSTGNADNDDWPGYDGTDVSVEGGAGWKGSSFIDVADEARVSDRTSAAFWDTSRYSTAGGRFVRTAP